MLGWNGFKYRNQVIVDVHAILMFVPELKDLLKTFPNLRRMAGKFRKLGISELEAAARLSVLVLERVIPHVPPDDRALTIAQLTRFQSDHFRWFRDQLDKQRGSETHDILPLAFTLGCALWYLGYSVDDQKLPEAIYEEFSRDVIGMLQGKPPDVRLRDRMHATFIASQGT